MQVTLRRRIMLLCLLLLLLVVPVVSTRAAEAFVSTAFDFSSPTIGKTIRLYIAISNPGPNTLKATSLQCTQQGTSLSASSISRLPDRIAPNTTFESEQYYRAASGGRTTVICTLKATDTVTGEQITASSPANIVDVSPETRLYIEAYSASRVATVGQTVFLTAVYGNRGRTAFTNVQISCPEQGRSLEFVSSRQTQTNLPPGQSGFIEYRLLAVRPGVGYYQCSVTATDASTGNLVTLLAAPVVIEVR
jgi:hypothetical protein